MGDVEVQFGPQLKQAWPAKQPARDDAQQSLFGGLKDADILPEDIETDDAREMRAMVKAHDYWQRKPTPAQSNPFEDS